MMNGDQSMIEQLIVAKQEMIRDYQARADATDCAELECMLKHFAEEEARQASEMKKLLRMLE